MTKFEISHTQTYDDRGEAPDVGITTVSPDGGPIFLRLCLQPTDPNAVHEAGMTEWGHLVGKARADLVAHEPVAAARQARARLAKIANERDKAIQQANDADAERTRLMQDDTADVLESAQRMANLAQQAERLRADAANLDGMFLKQSAEVHRLVAAGKTSGEVLLFKLLSEFATASRDRAFEIARAADVLTRLDELTLHMWLWSRATGGHRAFADLLLGDLLEPFPKPMPRPEPVPA